MKNSFKPNDLIGILLAIALIALGFILLFIHEQSSTEADQAYIESPVGAQTISIDLPVIEHLG